MKKIILLLGILCFSALAFAQTKQFGKLKVTEEKEIVELLTKSEEHLQGYRIQVFTGNASDRVKAEELKKSIETEFQVKAYVKYEAPLVKVRVGNFIDKLEAIAMREQLKKQYSNAYIVNVKEISIKDKVNEIKDKRIIPTEE